MSVPTRAAKPRDRGSRNGASPRQTSPGHHPHSSDESSSHGSHVNFARSTGSSGSNGINDGHQQQQQPSSDGHSHGGEAAMGREISDGSVIRRSPPLGLSATRRRSSLASLALYQASTSLKELSEAALTSPNEKQQLSSNSRKTPGSLMRNSSSVQKSGLPPSSPMSMGPASPSRSGSLGPNGVASRRPSGAESDSKKNESSDPSSSSSPTPSRDGDSSPKGYREVFEEVFSEVRSELAIQSSMGLDRKIRMLEPVPMRRRVRFSIMQYKHMRTPPRVTEAAHRSVHLCIPDWSCVPDMWTVGHTPIEPISVLLVDDEGQVVVPWSPNVEIKVFLVNAVDEIVYERFDFNDILAGHMACVNARGIATFPELRVLMSSDMARGGSFRLAFVATDWAIEPVVSSVFHVMDEARPHGAQHIYPRDPGIPIEYSIPASKKPTGSSRTAMTTPMHVAVAKGKPALCGLLMQKGDSMNVGAQDGLTALHIAAFLDHLDIVKMGLEKKADVNLPCVHGFTALHYAIIGGAEKTALYLLGRSVVNSEAMGLSGWHALHLAALADLRSVAVALIDLQCDVNVANFVDKQTPLHVAAFYGRENIACLLMDNGADPTMVTRRGWTALHLAVLGGNLSTVDSLLINRKVLANIDAALEGSRYTPLHIACLRARADIAKLLISRGADPRLSADKGWTTAHLAAVSGLDSVYEVIADTGGFDENVEVDGLLAPKELAKVFIHNRIDDLGPDSEIVPDILDEITQLSHAVGTMDVQGPQSAGGGAQHTAGAQTPARSGGAIPPSPAMHHSKPHMSPW